MGSSAAKYAKTTAINDHSCVLSAPVRAGLMFSSECDAAHISLPIALLECGLATSIYSKEVDMARKRETLASAFGMALALALTVLAITTWANAPDPADESAASPPPRQTIYRPQYWNLY